MVTGERILLGKLTNEINHWKGAFKYLGTSSKAKESKTFLLPSVYSSQGIQKAITAAAYSKKAKQNKTNCFSFKISSESGLPNPELY